MFQVSQICLLVPTSINKVFIPWLFNNGSDVAKVEATLNSRNVILFALSIIILSGLAALFGFLILALLAEKNSYEIIGSVFIILCATATLDSFYLFAVNLLHFVEKTKIISMITLTSVVCTVVILIVMGPLYGVVGAALSCFFGSLIRLVFSSFIGVREFQSYHLNR
jgi:O-antigen/teichoic acid export membrane protein